MFGIITAKSQIDEVELFFLKKGEVKESSIRYAVKGSSIRDKVSKKISSRCWSWTYKKSLIKNFFDGNSSTPKLAWTWRTERERVVERLEVFRELI